MYTLSFQWKIAGKTRTKIVRLENQIVIGRRAGSDVVITDPSVAGQHARMTQTGDNLSVTNLSTSNILISGRVNLAPGKSATLKSGDVLKLGNVDVTVSFVQLRNLKVRCSNCNTKIPADSETCPNCGASLITGGQMTTY